MYFFDYISLLFAMKTITLLPNLHKGESVILIDFVYDDAIKTHIKLLPFVKWTQTHKSFYIVDEPTQRRKLFTHLRFKKWYVNYTSLQKRAPVLPAKTFFIKLPALEESLKKELMRYKKWLQQKRLSANTVNTYVEVTTFFLRYAQLKKTQIYTSKLIEQFNYDFIYRANKSISYQNQCIKKCLI